jgi:hypothetical protein
VIAFAILDVALTIGGVLLPCNGMPGTIKYNPVRAGMAAYIRSAEVLLPNSTVNDAFVVALVLCAYNHTSSYLDALVVTICTFVPGDAVADISTGLLFVLLVKCTFSIVAIFS